jgi:hypothetical protein
VKRVDGAKWTVVRLQQRFLQCRRPAVNYVIRLWEFHPGDCPSTHMYLTHLARFQRQQLYGDQPLFSLIMRFLIMFRQRERAVRCGLRRGPTYIFIRMKRSNDSSSSGRRSLADFKKIKIKNSCISECSRYRRRAARNRARVAATPHSVERC